MAVSKFKWMPARMRLLHSPASTSLVRLWLAGCNAMWTSSRQNEVSRPVFAYLPGRDIGLTISGHTAHIRKSARAGGMLPPCPQSKRIRDAEGSAG